VIVCMTMIAWLTGIPAPFFDSDSKFRWRHQILRHRSCINTQGFLTSFLFLTTGTSCSSQSLVKVISK
jgi:hypothetical protein